MVKFIKTTKFKYRLLTPDERFELLTKRDKLSRKLKRIINSRIKLEDSEIKLLKEIRKLGRQIDTGKEKVCSVKKSKRRKK